MNNETKWDVFEDALRALEEFGEQGSSWEMAYDDLSARYSAASDAALPDNLPVIPKAVSEWIKKCKHRNVTLADTLCMEMRPENVRNWMAFKDGDVANDFDRAGYLRKQDLMAWAWVLGIWRVEETGEIVKLEAEK